MRLVDTPRPCLYLQAQGSRASCRLWRGRGLTVFKRISLFILTNLAVLMLLSVISTLLIAFGVVPPEFLGAYGPLMVMAAVFGFGGAFISLLASKWIAKWTTGAKVIDHRATTRSAGWWIPCAARPAGRHQHARGGDLRLTRPTPSPPARPRTARWSPSAPACCSRCSAMKSTRCSATKSHVANGDMVTLPCSKAWSTPS